MRIQGITKTSFVDGEGCRVVLWVSGCAHHCPGCQNPGSWDPEAGEEMTTGHLDRIIGYLKWPYVDGLTLSGGDPMYPGHRSELTSIAKFIRRETGKSIWMYTGYRFEEIRNEPILDVLDVIVDGKYMEEVPGYPYVGSGNQRIWRKGKDGIWRYDTAERKEDTNGLQ